MELDRRLTSPGRSISERARHEEAALRRLRGMMRHRDIRLLDWASLGLTADEAAAAKAAHKDYRAAAASLAAKVRTKAAYDFNTERIKQIPSWWFKRWVARLDTRTRHTHMLLNGQTVPVFEPFRVENEFIMIPGDPGADPALSVNCRCVLVAVPPKLNDLLVAAAVPAKQARTSYSDPMTSDDQYGQDLMTSMVAAAGCLPCQQRAKNPPRPADQEMGQIKRKKRKPVEYAVSEDEVVHWEGVIGVEGLATGDGRYIEKGSLSWDKLPIPLRYVSQDVGAHSGAEVVGSITEIERLDDGRIWGRGIFDTEGATGKEAARQVGKRFVNGVSMDLDNVSFEVRTVASMEGDGVELSDDSEQDEQDEQDELTVTTSARIRAATIVAIPAFADAQIYIVGDEEEEDPSLDLVTASAGPDGSWRVHRS